MENSWGATVATIVTGIIGALGAWQVAKMQYRSKKEEVLPIELQLILDSWKNELVRMHALVNELQAEVEELKKESALKHIEIANLQHENKILKERLNNSERR